MYLYGYHACRMALLNPCRVIEKIFVTDARLLKDLPSVKRVKVEVVEKKVLEARLPLGAVHQGISLLVQPLALSDLDFLADDSSAHQKVVVLDQVNDPHNVGAVLRSAAVFGAKAVIMTERHAPKESGTLAKSACGALELVPFCTVKNLAQALEALKKMGFWAVGFSEKGDKILHEIDLKGKIALVFGSEGDGMRQRTMQLCDFQVRLPVAGPFSTLNISNAAAVGLYETFKQQSQNIP